MALEVVGGASQHEPLEGAVAAGAHHEQVQFVAEGRQLLAGEPVDRTALGALEGPMRSLASCMTVSISSPTDGTIMPV